MQIILMRNETDGDDCDGDDGSEDNGVDNHDDDDEDAQLHCHLTAH